MTPVIPAVLSLAVAIVTISVGSCGQLRRHHENSSDTTLPSNKDSGGDLPQSSEPKEGGSAAPKQRESDGTITSGGGYIYGYESNPWFIGNTSQVSYCVDIDQDNFGVSAALATEAIEKSIHNWQETLKKAPFAHHQEEPVGTLITGTQEFIKVSCTEESVDIRFQLGRISDEQRRHLGHPQKFIASTVQTSYDEINMKGQGFIYVAPEKGDLRPKADDLAKSFWGFEGGLFLEATITHELGHVFGLQHNDYIFPMAALFCEEIVSQRTQTQIKLALNDPEAQIDVKNLIKTQMLHSFSGIQASTYVDTSLATELLGFKLLSHKDLPPEKHIKAVFTADSIIFYAQSQKDESRLSTGNGRQLSTFSLSGVSVSSASISQIRVPRKQTVMKIHDDEFSSEDFSGGRYRSLSFLDASIRRLSGFVINPVTKKETFIRATVNTVSPSVGDVFSIDVISNGKIEQLRVE